VAKVGKSLHQQNSTFPQVGELLTSKASANTHPREFQSAHVVRPLRIHVAGGFYHVTLRGNHQQDVFREHSDRALLNAVVGRALCRHEAQIHAYCWMSNHLHLLIRVSASPLGPVMRDIASNYARAFQLKMQTSGHLFERRYHATLIDVDAYLLAVLRYIHLNPVAAGLVRKVSEYRWSSHRAYAGGSGEPWLTTDFALAMFAQTRERAHAAYCRFVDSASACHLDERQLGTVSVLAENNSLRPSRCLQSGVIGGLSC
jgi:putative transposase